MARTIIVLMGFFLPFCGQAQLNEYAFEQLDSLQNAAPRPLVVLIYTDWCKYCAALKNTSLRDEQVVELLNDHYYFLSLDAESEKDIRLRRHTFSFKPSGNHQGIHELAEQLGTVDGAVAYPTLCVLNSAYEITYQHNQFISASNLIEMLEKLRVNP